jgi:cob(I)alamin adenosyltransferase
MTELESQRHNERMKKVKVTRDRMMATKTVEKGLIIVHTGNGKGRPTAAMGGGFTWDTQDRDADIATAMEAWGAVKAYIADPATKMVVSDEINIALRYDHIPLADVLETLKNKEMTRIKHPFRDGVKAQEGIEF